MESKMDKECEICGIGEYTLACGCEELTMREESMALMAGMTKAMIFALLDTDLSDKKVIANIIAYLEDFINQQPEYVNEYFSDMKIESGELSKISEKFVREKESDELSESIFCKKCENLPLREALKCECNIGKDSLSRILHKINNYEFCDECNNELIACVCTEE